MIIKIKYDKSTKQITVENDISEIVLSVTNSTKIDNDNEYGHSPYNKVTRKGNYNV